MNYILKFVIIIKFLYKWKKLTLAYVEQSLNNKTNSGKTE